MKVKNAMLTTLGNTLSYSENCVLPAPLSKNRYGVCTSVRAYMFAELGTLSLQIAESHTSGWGWVSLFISLHIVSLFCPPSLLRPTNRGQVAICKFLWKPCLGVKIYLINMNTFCDWLSETIVISVYDSFFRNFYSFIVFYCLQ